MKILAVEDDTASRAVLVAALKSLGHEVLAAADGEEALRLLATDQINLVVLDWLMPGIDGLELTRRIRAAGPDLPYTYVILLTVVEGRANWFAAMDAGVDDFLLKPIDAAVLRARVRVAERMLDLMAKNRALARLIPICMYCKRARTDSHFWQDLDRFLEASGDAMISHGVCPECNDTYVTPMLDEFHSREPAAKAVKR